MPELEAEGFGSGGIVQNRLMCEVRVADFAHQAVEAAGPMLRKERSGFRSIVEALAMWRHSVFRLPVAAAD